MEENKKTPKKHRKTKKPLLDYGNIGINKQIDTAKTRLQLETDSELAKYLGVHPLTVSRWRKGETTAVYQGKGLQRLRKLCTDLTWGSDEYCRNSFVACHTLSFDAAKSIYDSIMRQKDPLSSAILVHSISVKFADIITELAKQRGQEVLVKIHQVYDTPDAGELINCKLLPVTSERGVDICIKIGGINDEFEFLIVQEQYIGTQLVRRFGGIVCDMNLKHAARQALQHLCAELKNVKKGKQYTRKKQVGTNMHQDS